MPIPRTRRTARRGCRIDVTAIGAAFAFALALAGLTTAPARATEKGAPFDALWIDAQRWAKETGTVPEDCVFSLRFDPKSRELRSGYAAACDEPYRSPFYPWPVPSRAGARFTLEDIRAYAAQVWAESGRTLRFGTSAEEQLLETCGLIVGFTKNGLGAEAIECYWSQGSVLGRRPNTGFVVDTVDGRRVNSRLDDRIAHLGEREAKDILARLQKKRESRAGSATATEVVVRVEGQIVSRGLNRLLVRGRALPLIGESQTAVGVVTGDANLVVHYPNDDALALDQYLGGRHCFKEKRDRAEMHGTGGPEWVYGPCALGPDQYWMFERYPPGRPTVIHGPYRDYGDCDRDRKKLKAGRPGVAGHCAAKAKVAFRMITDGTLVVPSGAPPLE